MSISEDLAAINKAGFCVAGGPFGCACDECREDVKESYRVITDALNKIFCEKNT